MKENDEVIKDSDRLAVPKDCCDQCDAFRDFGVCWNKLCPCHKPENIVTSTDKVV